ncbi:MAG: hypothetical protein EZS28_031535 [Streblomastix strix]|uniref:Serine-threonine/tyrosine-protein kinase catalytic domain-containing protein n=1 Tax=Streblomastix strix TaxID=222440 RepID=A0A5J4UR64_9EUKA|nr:MAG: hypothetical protein EZS28_031535 [Streblomastix strix]
MAITTAQQDELIDTQEQYFRTQNTNNRGAICFNNAINEYTQKLSDRKFSLSINGGQDIVSSAINYINLRLDSFLYKYFIQSDGCLYKLIGIIRLYCPTTNNFITTIEPFLTTTSLIIDFATRGALTLAYLHKHKIVHGQISTKNVFVTEDSTFRIAQILVDVADSSVDEKLIIAQRGIFYELVNILKWAKEQNKELARPLQECVCQIVQTLIDENKPVVDISFQTEILTELKYLVDNTLSLDEIKFIHVDTLKQFTSFGTTYEQEKIMYDMGLAQTFLKTMKSQLCRVVEKSAVAIVNIMIYDGFELNKQEPHPNFLECDHKGIISSLFQDGIINGKSQLAKSICAYGLDWIFKTMQLPNEMKPDIVKQLKVGMKNESITLRS